MSSWKWFGNFNNSSSSDLDLTTNKVIYVNMRTFIFVNETRSVHNLPLIYSEVGAIAMRIMWEIWGKLGFAMNLNLSLKMTQKIESQRGPVFK